MSNEREKKFQIVRDNQGNIKRIYLKSSTLNFNDYLHVIRDQANTGELDIFCIGIDSEERDLIVKKHSPPFDVKKRTELLKDILQSDEIVIQKHVPSSEHKP